MKTAAGLILLPGPPVSPCPPFFPGSGSGDSPQCACPREPLQHHSGTDTHPNQFLFSILSLEGIQKDRQKIISFPSSHLTLGSLDHSNKYSKSHSLHLTDQQSWMKWTCRTVQNTHPYCPLSQAWSKPAGLKEASAAAGACGSHYRSAPPSVGAA